MTIDENLLNRFCGSDTLTRFNALMKNALLTDGALYVAKEGGAYWLMDLIASAQLLAKVRAESFQVWGLTVNPDKSALVTCDDGNGNIIYSQEIPYTDFELDGIKLYACDDGEHLIIMLPSEY